MSVGRTLTSRIRARSGVRLDDAQVLVPNYVWGCGKRYFAEIERHGLEGVMAKRLHSPYQAGRRCTDWLKIKVEGYPRRDRW